MKILAVLAVVLLAAACGAESGTDDARPTTAAPEAAGPEDAVRRLLTAMEAGSCSGVKDVVLTPATVDCEMIAGLEGSLAEEGIAVSDVSYAAGETVDSSSTVTTDWGNGEASDSWQVERVGGTWKVIFDSVE